MARRTYTEEFRIEAVKQVPKHLPLASKVL